MALGAYNGVDVVKGPLGKPGSSEHERFIRNVELRLDWYRTQMTSIYDSISRMWRLYLCKGNDPRTRDEDWRANIFPPIGHSNIETMVASVVSILTSADPLIQPEAVSDADMDRARSLERTLDYTYRKNKVVKMLTKQAREKYVAGTSFFKTSWAEQAHIIETTARPGEAEALEAAIQAAEGSGAPAPPDWQTEPEAFEQWRTLVNNSGRAKIPSPPYSGPRTIVRYRGPVFTRIPIWNVFLDPLVDEMDDQNFIVHRMVKPRAWIEDRAEKGFYDKEAVAFASRGWDGKELEQWEVQLAEDRGIAVAGGLMDPYFHDACELLEVWQPDTEVPFALIMNRKAVINKNPYSMPFEHGMCPISAVRHIVVPGQFYGLSALQPPETLFEELRKLRNLRSDGATLNVLPIFTKLREAGIPELVRNIRPGSIIPVSRPDAIGVLQKPAMPPEAYREPAEIKQEIADSMQVYDSTKGAPAEIGRVTGTEFESRANQAQLRMKLDALCHEEDIIPSVQQALSLWAQMSTDPIRVKVGGQPSPFVDLSRDDFIEGLDMQFRLRGATKAIKRDMVAQQLMLAADKFGAIMTPKELRLLATEFFETLDIRGSSLIISEEGTNEKQQDYEMQRQAAMAQMQMQTQQMAAQMAPAAGAQAPPAPPQAGGEGNGQPPQ